MNSKRFTLKLAGESGQGLNSAGEILVRSLKNTGFYVFGYREYPSLIKGGFASYQVDISDNPINSSNKFCNILMCMSRVSIHKYLKTLNSGGILIHCIDLVKFSVEEQSFIQVNNIQVKYIDAFRISEDILGSKKISNIVLLGSLWKILKLDLGPAVEFVKKEYSDKKDLLEADIKALDTGYNLVNDLEVSLNLEKKYSLKDSILTTGNHGISLGAIMAEVRALYAYPMTPTSSILEYLAEVSSETKMIVKQVEDEITAAQMSLGSMFMGVRSFTATSGGGFDLMTETISLAGITETPFVCVLGQRPGPGTGLPTWTLAGDLNLALFSGHGEYPKCVIGISNLETAVTLIQDAFNIAEQFQIPVIVLTEKQIAESLFQIEVLPNKKEIKRGLVSNLDLPNLKSLDRFLETETGVSKRWLPGQSSETYLANSDEHTSDGEDSEDSENVIKMMNKRMRKLESLKLNLAEPEYYGKSESEIVLVGWGSVKNTILDIINSNPDLCIGYLHYEYIFPLMTDRINSLKKEGRRLILVENNYLGQLGNLIKSQTGIDFEKRILKYDGRPFFYDELLNQINLL